MQISLRYRPIAGSIGHSARLRTERRQKKQKKPTVTQVPYNGDFAIFAVLPSGKTQHRKLDIQQCLKKIADGYYLV
jgi:hypothetical protein